MPFNIDIFTVIFLIGFAALIQAGMILVFGFLVNQYQGILYAIAGNISLAFGFLLLPTRNIAPDWLSILVANGLILAGIIFFYIALKKFTTQPINRYLVVAPLIICLLSLYYFTYKNESLALRIVTMSMIGIPLLCANMMTLLHTDNKKYRTSVYLIVIPVAIYTIIMILRAINALYAPPEALFSSSLVQVVTFVILFMASFFWTLGFINMNSQRLQSDLQDSANSDLLTGLPNRRAAVAFLQGEFARQFRNPTYFFSILIIDIDFLKEINDKFGHAVGDVVLERTSKIFRETIRYQDLVARWGGDEFIIALPLTRSADALTLGQLLTKSIKKGEFKFNQSGLIWTISIGVSESIGCGNIDDLLKKADIALYRSKQTRNAVTKET